MTTFFKLKDKTNKTFSWKLGNQNEIEKECYLICNIKLVL